MKGFLEVWNRGFVGGQEQGPVVNDRNQSQYSNMKISSLIYESTGIALVRENRGVIDVRSGINKVQVETQ